MWTAHCCFSAHERHRIPRLRANCMVCVVFQFKYAKISSKINGSVKKGVIFSTYSSLIGESQSGGKYRTRLKQLVHWLGREFDGLVRNALYTVG